MIPSCKEIFALIIFIGLLPSVIALNSGYHQTSPATPGLPPPVTGISTYFVEDHDPISIDGNGDFTSTAASEGWLGDGTAISPYLIDGYNIISGIKAISVNNTNVYFRISNCSFSGVSIAAIRIL